MELRPHQVSGIDFLLQHNNRAILADAAGLGKTKIVLDVLFKQQNYPVLVVCTKLGLSVWQNELLKWYKMPSMVVTGTPKQRSNILQKFITSDYNFIITNYAHMAEVLQKLTPMFFQTLVLDEYHLPGLLNKKTKIYKLTKSIAKIIPHSIMLTGTPMRKTVADWYAPLSIIAPDDFTSYWRFVNQYCVQLEGFYGRTLERMPQNKDIFLAMLDKYRRRCTDKSHLPPKTRQPIPVEMTKKQKKLYEQLRTDMYLNEDGNFWITPNKLTNVLRCRQLMVSPKILGFNDNGGALNMLKDLVDEELSEGNSLVIFTPFRKALDLIEDCLESIKDLVIFQIHGGMTHEQHTEVQTRFQGMKTKRKVVICTIKSGVSMTLTEASVAVFLGYEYSIGDNTQAENRLFRETQKNKVRIYYLLYRGNAVDERGIEILNDKHSALSIDVSREDYYRGIVDVSNK